MSIRSDARGEPGYKGGHDRQDTMRNNCQSGSLALKYLTAASARERRKTAALISHMPLGTLSALALYLLTNRTPVPSVNLDPNRRWRLPRANNQHVRRQCSVLAVVTIVPPALGLKGQLRTAASGRLLPVAIGACCEAMYSPYKTALQTSELSAISPSPRKKSTNALSGEGM
ncbi:MAG: hypothetical protein K0S85_1047, partial [Pseudomonas orientalis]|nr:hypothetical protein [Pseudomonas orientalis]